MQLLIDGVNTLVKCEQALERNGNIDKLMPAGVGPAPPKKRW